MRKFISVSVTVLTLVMITTLLSSNSSCQDATNIQNKENAQAEKVKREILDDEISCKGRIVLSNSFDHKANVYIIRYDGCEYLVGSSNTNDSRGGTSITIEHSASCKNKIHKTNEDDEL